MSRAPKTSRITMQDVAQRAGVSQSTVSFVINATPGITIAEDTKQRVRKAVKELGYRPNAIAQNLRTRRSDSIGFITDGIAITPYAGRIFEGAQDAAWESGKVLLLVNTKGQGDLERAAANMLLERQVEGLIYATVYHHAVNLVPDLRGIPTVLLDCFVADHSLPSVVPDEVQGGYHATRTLIQAGHRRIGFLNNIDPIPATSGRLEGYQQALAEAGITFDPALTRTDFSDQGGGYRSTLDLLRTTGDRRPTGLFCFNDRMAMGAYDALRQEGLQVPQDVAVVGFDNQEIISAGLQPPLSTMALPHYEMGAWAVNYLIGAGSGPAPPDAVQHRIACSYVPRASV